MLVCVLVFVLSSTTLSQQHLSYPINFCSMASTCIHDGRGVCASSPDGCSRRSFLDQCDMYEYNCDYGTHFKIADCEEKCPCCNENPKREDSREFTKVFNDTTSVENNDHKIKLSLNSLKEEIIYTKVTTTDCSNYYRCRRPSTWATTAQGEIRDFFRIINGV
ncbi:uncharacterized protein [Maniola hyperantus]|uniref:uncharacterized protein isoform X1 n=1 Tax=Aphantopus hyperantus TaxID=2795564 RepID=UPI0015681CAF|nr:uncharacterized protein LOC117992230 isoform X1 [Maniola hyperantus]